MKTKSCIIAATLLVCSATAAAQTCNVGLSVIPAQQGEDIPELTNDYVCTVLTNLVANNATSGDPAQSPFFISAKFNHLTDDVTPGPPAQNVVRTYLTLYIGDLSTKTVYASTSMELRGVGTSYQRALMNALRGINPNNRKVADFVSEGSQKVLAYYNANYPQIIAKAKRAAAKNAYDEALWILLAIPECCDGYAQAYSLEQQYFQQYINQEGTRLYNAAYAAWSAGHDAEAAAAAYAYLLQIDPESSAYSKAQALAKEMSASVKSDRDFELREKYHDAIDIEKSRIDAIRQVGVAYGRGQQPTTTNIAWLH